jgi:hypothetical protein
MLDVDFEACENEGGELLYNNIRAFLSELLMQFPVWTTERYRISKDLQATGSSFGCRR